MRKTPLIRNRVEHGNLVRPPGAFHLVAIYLFRSCPSFRRAKDDHGPARTRGIAGCAGVLLEGTNLEDTLLQGGSHFLMHRRRVVAFDEVRFVAVPDQQRFQFFVRNARENRGIRDLVAVEVQHRKDSSIANRIQEFVRMPGGRKRTGLRLAVTNRDRDDEIGIVECCPVSMGDGVAKLPAFVNGTWRFRCAVRADASGKRELAEELEQTSLVKTLVRINLGVVTLEIAVGECGRSAMARTGDVHHIQVILLDETVEMDPNQRLPGI